MNCPYRIRINSKKIYREFEIAENTKSISLGTTAECEFRLNQKDFLRTIVLTFTCENDEWSIRCNDEIFLFNASNGKSVAKLGFSKIKHGDRFIVRYANGNDVFELEFTMDFEAQIPDFFSKVDISAMSELKIGADSNCDLVLNSEYCANALLTIRKSKGKYYISEQSSLYGSYLNGSRLVEEKELKDYDFISISDAFFFFKEGVLYFDSAKTNSYKLTVMDSIPKSIFSYPQFIRNTRRKIKPDVKLIKILDPSTKPTKPEVHLVTSLLPAIIMFALVVVLRGIMATTMGTYIIFSICSMGLGLFTTVAGLIQGQKKYKSDIKNREDTYRAYIAKKEQEIEAARKAEVNILNEIYYSPVIGVKKVLNFDSDIFDRVADDPDYLDITIGIGKRMSGQQVDYKVQEKLEEGDELTLLPQKVAEKYKFLENAPITLSIAKAGAVGVVGSENDCYLLFKNMLADIVCRQFVDEVSIYLLLDNDVKKYEWVKLLPQIQQPDGLRNIVFDKRSKNVVFEDLFKELTFRTDSKESHKHIVIFALDDNDMVNHPISKFIEKAETIQTTFIFFERRTDFLPLYCSEIIELQGNNHGVLYQSNDRTNQEEFEFESIQDSTMKQLVRKLAPVFNAEVSLESSLRKKFSMYEMLGIYMASDLNIQKRWSESVVYESMAAPLGINAKNEIVYLDLHEKAHGPHGLVAGTTGSGKSEILQSYILSAALNFHPYEVGFVIIDFKGGGMANQFKNLPHLIGTITNIDGKEINRSLKSIKAELNRRQELFREADVNQIDNYIKLYKSGKTNVPLPHLIIIVDEFAELKAEQPEFMKELISAARIGRSLGVHLILATQKPAGQVNEQIWSNSKFKLCLKVQDQQDSKEVIKSPLAAEIKEPGRAYLQVGNNEVFELFQSAYSGGPSVREDETTQKSFVINKYDMSGRSGVLFEQKKPKSNKEDDVSTELEKTKNSEEIDVSTELKALVYHILEYCKAENIDKLPNICLPGLKDVYNFQDYEVNSPYMEVPIGIYDDPDRQYQGTYISNIGNENTMVIGSSQMGKTNFLQLCIRYLAAHNSPEDVNIYILDFASGFLDNYNSLCHVGGVVQASEDEKLKNLFKLLEAEMNARKSKLMNKGVSSFQAYREAGFTDMPKIYMVLDSFNAFRELYIDHYEQIFVRICRDGISLGISVIMTNASTNGIGYRHMSNFSNRICFTCNENSDYSVMLTRCRMEPKAIPGRFLFQRDKEIFEAQSYLAFEGEKEYDRTQTVRQFVKDMNERYEDCEPAVQIPCIPEELKWKDFKKKFGSSVEKADVPIGLDFANIEPVSVSVQNDCEFAVFSRKRERVKKFINTFMAIYQYKNFSHMNLRLYVIDRIEREIKEFKDYPLVNRYTIDPSESELILEEVLDTLKSNKMSIISEDEDKKSIVTNIIIVNSKDAINYISGTKPVLDKYKEIVNSYKNYGVLFIYSDVENTTVPYSGPEILKRIKDSKKMILLDNLNVLKVFDISPSQIRTFSKEILDDEGYWINGADIMKIKLFNEGGKTHG